MQDTIDDLILDLQSPDPEIRARGAEGIGRLGSKGLIAIDYLNSALNDRDEKVLLAVIWALGEMGPSAKNSLNVLEEFVNHPSEILSKSAKTTIGLITGKLKSTDRNRVIVLPPSMTETIRKHLKARED